MVDLQPRKIPILTGINDVPATVGQPNYPNDSLLCANYNDLIDDVETELTTIKGDVTTLDSNVASLQSQLQSLPTGGISSIFAPSSSNTQRYNEVIEDVLDSFTFVTGLIEKTLNYEIPPTGTYDEIRLIDMSSPQSILNIDVVEQFNGNISYTATLSGTNSEFLEVTYRINSLADTFLVLPVYIEITMNDPVGGYNTHRVLVRHYNLNRVTQGAYGWENTTALDGGGSY